MRLRAAYSSRCTLLGVLLFGVCVVPPSQSQSVTHARVDANKCTPPLFFVPWFIDRVCLLTVDLRRGQVLAKCADDDGMISVIYGKTPTEKMAIKKVKADAGQVYCSSGTFGGDPVRLALRVFWAGVARWWVAVLSTVACFNHLAPPPYQFAARTAALQK